MTDLAAPARVLSLWTALDALPQRLALRLSLRLVEGRPDAECAALYGTSTSAFAVHLFRAARLFQRALERGGSTPLLPSAERLDPVEEQVLATRLLALVGPSSLEPEASSAAPEELASLLPLLRELGERGPQIRALAQARARAELESPAYRRNEWLRRIALAALFALAAWLYRHPHG